MPKAKNTGLATFTKTPKMKKRNPLAAVIKSRARVSGSITSYA